MPLTKAEQEELAALKRQLTALEPRPAPPGTLPVETQPFQARKRAELFGEIPESAVALETIRTAPSLIPGPAGAGLTGLSNLAADVMGAEPPNLPRAGRAAGTALAGGAIGAGLARGAGALSRLRLLGIGASKDPGIAARGIQETGTALKPEGTAESLQQVMRGGVGREAMRASRGAEEAAIAQQLPTRPPLTIDTPVPPTGPFSPPFSREQFTRGLERLRDLGKQGFSGRSGEARDVAAAQAARIEREQVTKQIRQGLSQADPTGGLTKAFDAMQRRYGAGSALLRLFQPRGPASPEPLLGQAANVEQPLSATGFNLRELQAQAGKAEEALRARLGPQAMERLMRTLFRGGRPPVGDQPLSIPLSIRGGLRVPIGLTRLAGPGRQFDPALLQMLLQSGGVGGVEALSGALRGP